MFMCKRTSGFQLSYFRQHVMMDGLIEIQVIKTTWIKVRIEEDISLYALRAQTYRDQFQFYYHNI